MKELNNIKIKIEKTRRSLYDLINNKNLLVSEVISLSQDLDQLLNEYHNIIHKEVA